MSAYTLETLYPLVTEAIHRAETLTDLGVPGATSAWLDVSRLEEEIARILPPADPEGAIARRGAVRAAISANQGIRARELVGRFAAEAGVTETLHTELTALLAEALNEHRAIRRRAARVAALSHHALASSKAA